MVDWRTSVAKYLEHRSFETLNSPATSISIFVRIACAAISWPLFAQQWRSSYIEFTKAQADRSDDDPALFKTIDEHHHESLRTLLWKYEISTLWTDVEVLAISKVWHFLDSWPDSARGLLALKQCGFSVCTLSNGNLNLLKDLAAFTDTSWTKLISAEHFHTYKPSRRVYIGACEFLDLKPSQCAMVAAHLGDLQAARACGLQTIYIEREAEESWPAEKVNKAKEEGWVDMWVGLDEKGVGGGILEVVRNFEAEYLCR